MTKEEIEHEKQWDKALAIIDDNLGVCDGIIGNRFACATAIVGFAKEYANNEVEEKTAPLLEALKEAREDLYWMNRKSGKLHDRSTKAVAKYDAIIKEYEEK